MIINILEFDSKQSSTRNLANKILHPFKHLSSGKKILLAEKTDSRERETGWEGEMGMRMGNGNRNRNLYKNLHAYPSTQGSDETLGLMAILFTSTARTTRTHGDLVHELRSIAID